MATRTTLALALSLVVSTAAHAQPSTDIWLGSLDLSGERVAITDLVNITQRPGYDNQPAFFPDQRTLAYTTQRDGRPHAVLYDLATGSVRLLPGARGFSPTPTDDGKQLMVTFAGRVALHDLDGTLLRELTDTVRVGYYSRVDARTFVLFINDPERRIVVYDVDGNTLETLSRGAVTPLVKVPNENAYTFVAETGFPSAAADQASGDRPIQLELRRLDLDQRRVQTIAAIPFPTSGHHAWTPRQTLLMASGSTIFEWSPTAPDTWKPVATLDDPDLHYVSRIVISPRGDRIAIVSMPRHEMLIRHLRLGSNAAIAAHAVDGIVNDMEDSVVVIRGSGARLTGTTEVRAFLTEAFAQSPDLVYVRTPDRVDVSTSDPLAAEHGTWTGRWTAADGRPATANGTYLVMWRKTTSPFDGSPQWKIRSELYVTLGCTNCR